MAISQGATNQYGQTQARFNQYQAAMANLPDWQRVGPLKWEWQQDTSISGMPPGDTGYAAGAFSPSASAISAAQAALNSRNAYDQEMARQTQANIDARAIKDAQWQIDAKKEQARVDADKNTTKSKSGSTGANSSSAKNSIVNNTKTAQQTKAVISTAAIVPSSVKALTQAIRAAQPKPTIQAQMKANSAVKQNVGKLTISKVNKVAVMANTAGKSNSQIAAENSKWDQVSRNPGNNAKVVAGLPKSTGIYSNLPGFNPPLLSGAVNNNGTPFEPLTTTEKLRNDHLSFAQNSKLSNVIEHATKIIKVADATVSKSGIIQEGYKAGKIMLSGGTSIATDPIEAKLKDIAKTNATIDRIINNPLHRTAEKYYNEQTKYGMEHPVTSVLGTAGMYLGGAAMGVGLEAGIGALETGATRAGLHVLSKGGLKSIGVLVPKLAPIVKDTSFIRTVSTGVLTAQIGKSAIDTAMQGDLSKDLDFMKDFAVGGAGFSKGMKIGSGVLSHGENGVLSTESTGKKFQKFEPATTSSGLGRYKDLERPVKLIRIENPPTTAARVEALQANVRKLASEYKKTGDAETLKSVKIGQRVVDAYKLKSVNSEVVKKLGTRSLNDIRFDRELKNLKQMKGFSDYYNDVMAIPNSKDAFTARTNELLADKKFDKMLKDMKFFNKEYMQKGKLNTDAEAYRTAKQDAVNSEAHANGIEYSEDVSLPNKADGFTARMKQLKDAKVFDKELKTMRYFSEDYMKKSVVKEVSEQSVNSALAHVFESNRTISAIKDGYNENNYREQMKHERNLTHQKANALIKVSREALAKIKKEKPESTAHKKANDAMKAAKAAKEATTIGNKGTATLREMEELERMGKNVPGIEALREAERNKVLDARSKIDEYTYRKELNPEIIRINKVIDAARSLSESDKEFDTEMNRLKDKDYDKKLNELRTNASKKAVIGSELRSITEDAAKISREAMQVSEFVNREASKVENKTKTDNVKKAVERNKTRNEEIRKSYGDESGSSAITSNGQKLLIKAKVEEKVMSDGKRVKEGIAKVEEALKTLEKPEGRRLRDLDLREEKERNKLGIKSDIRRRAATGLTNTSYNPFRRPPIAKNAVEDYEYSRFYPMFAPIKSIINDSKTIIDASDVRSVIRPTPNSNPYTPIPIPIPTAIDVHIKPIIPIPIPVKPVIPIPIPVKPVIPLPTPILEKIIIDIKVINDYQPRPKKEIPPYFKGSKPSDQGAAAKRMKEFYKTQRLIKNELIGLKGLIG